MSNIYDEFIREEHVGVIEKFCKEKKCLISFRKAKEETIQRMKDGNPCKGHDVLDKSISGDRYESLVLEPDSTTDVEHDKPLLKGLIGKWDGNKLLGVYDEKSSVHKVDPDLFTKLRDSEEKIKFLTGDYDIHDIFVKEGSETITASMKEKELLEELNERLLAIEEPRRKKAAAWKTKDGYPDEVQSTPYHYIRHGAQINYCLHMALKESERAMVYSVIVPDYNVLFCDDNGKWTLSKVQKDFEGWYEEHHITLKSTFTTDWNGVSAVFNQIRRNRRASIVRGAIRIIWNKPEGDRFNENSHELIFVNQLKNFLQMQETAPNGEEFVRKNPVETVIAAYNSKQHLDRTNGDVHKNAEHVIREWLAEAVGSDPKKCGDFLIQL